MPLLFNLVLIEVASRLAEVEDVGYTIYYDDITLWVEGGSDARVEEALQRAVQTIEESLEGTGLRCSPSMSELLLYRPKEGPRTEKRSDREEISICTRDGNVIPTVADIRILGMLINEHGGNGNTTTRVVGKVANAIRLLRRFSN